MNRKFGRERPHRRTVTAEVESEVQSGMRARDLDCRATRRRLRHARDRAPAARNQHRDGVRIVKRLGQRELGERRRIGLRQRDAGDLREPKTHGRGPFLEAERQSEALKRKVNALVQVRAMPHHVRAGERRLVEHERQLAFPPRPPDALLPKGTADVESLHVGVLDAHPAVVDIRQGVVRRQPHAHEHSLERRQRRGQRLLVDVHPRPLPVPVRLQRLTARRRVRHIRKRAGVVLLCGTPPVHRRMV